MKLAANLERRHVRLEIKCVGHIAAIQDKIERKRPWVRPALIVRHNGFFRAQLLDILDLVRRVREGVRLSSEGNAPLNAQVTQATDAADGNFLARTDSGADQRGVGSDTGAEKGCGIGRVEGVGDLEGEVFVGADVVGEAAMCPAAVLILGVVRILMRECQYEKSRYGSWVALYIPTI